MSDMPNMQPPDSPTANPSQTRATDEQRRRVLDHIADLKHAGRRREAQAFAAVIADSEALARLNEPAPTHDRRGEVMAHIDDALLADAMKALDLLLDGAQAENDGKRDEAKRTWQDGIALAADVFPRLQPPGSPTANPPSSPTPKLWRVTIATTSQIATVDTASSYESEAPGYEAAPDREEK